MSKFRRALEQARRDRALLAERPATSERAADVPGWPPRIPAPAWTPSSPAHAADGVDAHLVSLVTPTAYQAEQYRALRHVLEQARRTHGVQVVAVSSPGDGDGKTTTAINAAGALAQAPETRVLLVDADLRKSSIARRLALDDATRPGLVEAILEAGLTLDAVVQPLPAFNLHVLPTGSAPLRPYEILKSPRLGEILAEARRRYDHIVLDTPPLVAAPDSRLVAEWVDGFLLVVAAHRTRSGQLGEALDLLDPSRVIGLVFNGDEDAPSPRDSWRRDGMTNGHRQHPGGPTWWPLRPRHRS
jgi:capsular exopolysaccharide synthesis family protein